MGSVYFPGASLKDSILMDLAPAACVSDKSFTLDDILRCVQAKGEVSACIRKTVKKVIADWLDLAPATRAHMSKLAQEHRKLFANLPEIPPGDLARMCMPWQIADALYDDRRRKSFKEILDAGLDLQNQRLVTSSTHGVGDLQLMLADKA
jgi:hypothetical protein